MRLKVSQLDLPPEYSVAQLSKVVAKQLRCDSSVMHNLKVVHRSIDARGGLPLVKVIVEVDVSGKKPNGKRDVEVVRNVKKKLAPIVSKEYSGLRPVVVGAGPAGLMAAFAARSATLRIDPSPTSRSSREGRRAPARSCPSRRNGDACR